MPIQKRFLSPYPDYVEPTDNVVVDGVTKPVKESLYMYLAQARFVVAKAPDSIDLAHYATLSFLEHIDPAIKHQLITSADEKARSKTAPSRIRTAHGAKPGRMSSAFSRAISLRASFRPRFTSSIS